MERRLEYIPSTQLLDEIAASVEDPTGRGKSKVSRLMGPVMREFRIAVEASFRTTKVAVEANGTAPMPDDTIRPVKAFIERAKEDGTVLFQLGNMELHDTAHALDCEVADPKSVSSLTLPNYYTQAATIFSLYNPFYREKYGLRETRFFGFYGYRASENRLEFSGVSQGEVVIVVYESKSEAYSMVSAAAAPVIRARVLQQFYEAVDPGKAQYYFRELRRARATFKRYKMSGYSYEDYLDWVTSSYSNEPR